MSRLKRNLNRPAFRLLLINDLIAVLVYVICMIVGLVMAVGFDLLLILTMGFLIWIVVSDLVIVYRSDWSVRSEEG